MVEDNIRAVVNLISHADRDVAIGDSREVSEHMAHENS
jgi:hypothetical protein